MTVETINISAVPFLLLAWFVDVFLFAVAARWILCRLSATRDGRFCLALGEIVDPVPLHVHRGLSAWRRKPCQAWTAWALVVGAGLIVRHLLLLIALGIS